MSKSNRKCGLRQIDFLRVIWTMQLSNYGRTLSPNWGIRTNLGPFMQHRNRLNRPGIPGDSNF